MSMVNPQRDWACINCDRSSEPPYPDVFDTIIIGAGPAGMTACVYAARRKLKTLLITSDFGGQMNWASDIQNWTGVIQATGPELVAQLSGHVKKVDDDNASFDLWVREKEKVTSVEKGSSGFVVKSGIDKAFSTRTVVCTAGKKPRILGIPGESIAMEGNGLSFSATSDAPLYEGKKMAVIGGGNSAMDVSLQLAKFTDDITLFTNLDHLIGEGVMMEKIEANPNIGVRYNIEMKEILLDKNNQVRGIKFADGGDEEEFECEGVFEEIGQVPATDFVADLLDLNEHNEIITDRNMHTSVPGFFAAGDCTDEIHKQTIVAAGQGAVAALEAHKYLLEH